MLLDIEGFGAGCIFYDRLVMHGFECCSTGGVQEPPATPSPSSSGLNAAADASGSLEGIGDDAHKAVIVKEMKCTCISLIKISVILYELTRTVLLHLNRQVVE